MKIQALNSENSFESSWWHNTLVHDDSKYEDKMGNYFINYQMALILKTRKTSAAEASQKTYVYPITNALNINDFNNNLRDKSAQKGIFKMDSVIEAT
jgi:hypothetical protein